MPQARPKIYIEDPQHKIQAGFMSDAAYAEALDSLVILCTDAVIINRQNKTFYLAMRKIKPQQDWWIIGGRTKAGELPEDSIIRCVKRETKLDIEPNRFKYLRMNRYWFKDRQQEPQDHGSDTMAYTYYVELTDDEIKQVAENLSADEYDTSSGLQEFDLKRLKQVNAHPMLIDLYHDIFE